MATSTLGSGTLVLAGTTSGTTTVTATAVAGTTTLTLPAATDTLVGKATTDTLTNKTLTGAVMNGTLGATTPSTVAATTLTTSSTVTHNGGTANGVPYLDGSKVLTTGSALVFDGTNLGVGVTPSAWGSSFRAIDISTGGSVRGSATGAGLYGNLFVNSSGNLIYKQTGYYGLIFQAQADNGAFAWYNAPSGTTGNTASLTQAMTLDASGKLGIGVTNPSVGLVVAYGTDGIIGNYYSSAGANSRISFSNNALLNNNVSIGSASDALVMYTANTERARIDSSGNLLVGTTDANPNSGTGVKINSGTGARTSVVGAADTNANFAFTAYSTSPSAYRFQVGYGGTIYATSTSITAISDASLKTNVRDLETGLTEVMALQPRRFDWINGDASNVAGFIAQEVQQVLPDLIEDYQYNDEEIKLGLKMGDILPTLVKAIQELKAEFDAYKASHP